VLRYTAPPRFAGPPRHRHAVTTEAFYVLEGQLSVDLEESTLLLGPGEHAGVPVDTVHAFRNDSDSPTTFLVIAVPLAWRSSSESWRRSSIRRRTGRRKTPQRSTN
jgi:mannose-6-phosphate isomerase-like protein (cupin superfamily)